MENNYCAFLRGVNVNGTRMKMADVQKVFSNAGIKKVTTVLATGNVLFHSDKPVTDLKPMLEKVMTKRYGFDVHMFIKTATEIDDMVKNIPFTANKDLHRYVFVTEAGIADKLLNDFSQITPVENEKAKVIDDVFYWQLPKGSTLKAGFSRVLGDKKFKDKLTSRNVNTMEKILAKFATL
ncbi:MAG: DUF1697 domain-containing protein [Micrococcaceae bacterium]